MARTWYFRTIISVDKTSVNITSQVNDDFHADELESTDKFFTRERRMFWKIYKRTNDFFLISSIQFVSMISISSLTNFYEVWNVDDIMFCRSRGLDHTPPTMLYLTNISVLIKVKPKMAMLENEYLQIILGSRFLHESSNFSLRQSS